VDLQSVMLTPNDDIYRLALTT